ncbi:MAG: hypothetical protein Q9165_001486 [Trypethelium subeluteriae]
MSDPHKNSLAWRSVMDVLPRIYAPPTQIPIGDPPSSARDPAKPPFDMVVHMGIATRRDYFSIETLGHRDGYELYEDVNHERLPEGFGRAHWLDCPEILHTTFDTDDVLRRWKLNLLADHTSDGEDIDLRLSDDAGHFLCDFIYFSSLSTYYRLNRRREDGERPVLFLHIPAKAEEDDILKGRETAVALIRAMVESRKEAK